MRPGPAVDLTQPGYVVLSSGPLVAGSEVVVGEYPQGLGGPVTWRWATVYDDAVPGPPPVLEGELGWYVPAGAERCPRCKDVNWEASTRLCVTCTRGDSGYADGAFAQGWSAAAAAEVRRAWESGRVTSRREWQPEG